MRQLRVKRALHTGNRVWRRIRLCHLADNPACECGRLATEVDHEDGNPCNNDANNLKSYCKPCHSRKTVLQDGGFGRPKQ